MWCSRLQLPRHLGATPTRFNLIYQIPQPIAKRNHDASCGENPEETDVQARIHQLTSDLRAKGFRRCSHTCLASLYNLLLNLGIKSSTIEAQILETPDILNYSKEQWEDTCEVMVDNGLPSLHILQSVALYPRLLREKPSTLNQKLNALRNITVGKQNLLSLVIKYPILYTSEPSMIMKRMKTLSNIFIPADLKLLIRHNPNVLTDRWHTILDKLTYIDEEMGLDQSHIARTKALTKSLLHIKTRHQFLHRAGLYNKPNLVDNKQSYRQNPLLSDIMDTSNIYFANKVAKLTHLEYNVFHLMMEEELRGVEDDPEDSEEEEEDFAALSYRKHRDNKIKPFLQSQKKTEILY